LWKSTIERGNQSPVWDLRPLGSKESGYVLTPHQRTGHKVRRALSGFVYRRNPVAKAISHFQLWKKKRKAARKKKKAEAFSTVRAVGVAADDVRTLSGGRKTRKTRKHKHKRHDGTTEVVSECDEHHHNPKHLPTRVKHYVKEHHQKHTEEPRDPAITTVVTEMHNRFRARFFPPLKVSVYDWVAVDQQEFLGRVEIDPAVVYLLEQEVIAGRKRASASGVTTESLARANAADVARENARLCNRGRRGSFLREMIDTDMESDEDEERELEELAFEDDDNEVSKRKAKEEKNEDDEKNEDNEKREKKEGVPARGDDEVAEVEEEEKEEAKEEDVNEKAEEKEEVRNRKERDRDEDEAQRRNERARLQMRASIRRAAGSPEELERLNPASADADADAPSDRRRTGDYQDHSNQKQPQPQPQPPQQQKHQAPANDENAMEGKEARKRERQEMEREKRERKETEKREREQRKQDEHDRKKREEEAKRRTRKMSKAGLQVEDATIAKEEEERGITVVMPLYPGEEERNTPGLERRHEGLCGHISITLTVTPPHWAADCSTISQQPLPKS
jgi:hypothetical protein